MVIEEKGSITMERREAMLKLYLAVLLLGISVSAGAGKYTYPSMGNTNSSDGYNRVESNARARDSGPQPVSGGKVSNQGEQPISDQAIEEHRIGGLAAELDKQRHEREAKCAEEAKQHKADPDCD
jgi:hypothetical protein